MNTIWIVMPILIVLMFLLGIDINKKAITIASSPFIFNSGEMALPAICYALLMNVILLTYVYCIRRKQI